MGLNDDSLPGWVQSMGKSLCLGFHPSLSLPRFDPFPFRELQQRFQPNMSFSCTTRHLAIALH